MELHSITGCTTLFISMLVLLPQDIVGATDYTVGDAERWTLGVNYQTWAQQFNFTVGDALIFSYIKGQHNVFQVVEDTFRSCSTRSGVVKRYVSGNDVVNLTQATSYWFICNVKDHCRGGMRFGISVASASPSPGGGGGGESPPLPMFQPPPPPPPPLPRSGASGVRMERWSWWVVMLVQWSLFK